MPVQPPEEPLRPGERVSLRHRPDAGRATDLIGFVVAVDAAGLRVVDRRGRDHRVLWTQVDAWRRVGVARGRTPMSAPADLLDALAAGAGVSGRVFVVRLSELLADERPPAEVSDAPAELPVPGGTARVEGEWVTSPASADLVAVAWWATRRDARSLQVRTDDPEVIERLLALGFRER